MQACGRRATGFTLIEVLVVTFICVLIMGVGATIYSTCLRAYREAHGRTEVFQTAKFITRDLREALGNMVPVKGNWVNLKGKFLPGLSVDSSDAQIDKYYRYSSGTPSKWTAMTRNEDYDYLFSGPQYASMSTTDVGDNEEAYQIVRGYWRNGGESEKDYQGLRGWWMPAFFGRRHEGGAVNDEIIEADNILAGSWGWPKPDYRLDADVDRLAAGNASLGNGGNLCCWFYAESRYFKSPYTLALDNANIVLVSLKFSMMPGTSGEKAKLSILRHQIVGFDTASQGLVKGDLTIGEMIRSIQIEPYYLDATGHLALMDDNALGCGLDGTPTTTAGTGDAVPRCFDVRFTLRNPGNLKKHRFAFRVFHLSNPQ